MLQKRLHWSQGTIQVLLKENPLVQRGLTIGQRLMYLGTMWSYLAGFAALAFLAAPVLYLVAGVQPVTSYGDAFWVHLLPYLLVSQLLFRVVGHGLRTWRGQQYNLALFPLWIRACVTAAGNVFLGRELGFVVTPKAGGDDGPTWRLIRPQLVAMAALVVAAGIGIARLSLGLASAQGTYVNLVWVAYDLLVLSVVLRAARFRAPHAPERTRT